MKTLVLTTVLVSCLGSGAIGAGHTRSYYNDSRIQTMRTNIAKYDWARSQRDTAIAKAEKWAAFDDARLRSLVIPPQVWRGYDVHQSGCPVHGKEIYNKGGYAWIIDLDKPFKVKCPIGGEEYPSNDFAAYLASGMKDSSLLTGDYADDGYGWHKPGDEGTAKYWFVAYYAHWSMQRFITEALESLGNAALFVEDKDPAKAKLYAHKLGVLLHEMAIYYPDYDYKTQSRENVDVTSNYNGKITNFIWECGWPEMFARAYDAMKPYLAGDTELQKSTGKSAAQIDEYIRERTMRHGAIEIMEGKGRIRGNYGTHQRTLLIVAQAMNEKTASPTSDEMIKWVNENGYPVSIRDLGLRDALVNLTYRDGNPPESFSYNEDWMDNLTEVAETLAELGINYFENPRFQRALLWSYDLMLGGTYTPSFGDVGNIFGAAGHWSPEQNQRALRNLKNPDPRFAWGMKGTKPERFDIWSPAVDDILADFARKPEPRVGFDSVLFPGYGIAGLQSGADANKTATSLAYGANPNHSHWDQLNFVFFGQGNALVTDLGYPDQFDGSNPRLSGYHNNTIAHNTVTVDGRKQGRKPGSIHAYSRNKFAQVADVSCEGAYEGIVSLYRRSQMLVEVSREHSYLFDVFYVRGGKQHDWALHGTQADFFCTPALGPVQTEGTLAGPDVPYEHFYDDADLKDKPVGSVNYTAYTGSGFQFLTNVQRGPLNGYAHCDWKLTRPLPGQPARPWNGIALRAHLIGQDEEIIACDGPVQQYDHLPKTIKCLIRRRVGDNLASCFTTVLEPYKGAPWIKRVSPVKITPNDGQAAAAMIVMANGARHYVFHSLYPEKTYTLDGKLRVTGQSACLVMDIHSRPVKCMLLNGKSLVYGKYVVKGNGIRRTSIASVDYHNGVIELADPILTPDLGPDNVVLVRNTGFADCVTPRKMLDKKRFSIGDEDLRVAGGPVTELKPDEITTSARNLFALPGHTITNGSYEPLGRLTAKRPAGWMVQGYKPLTWDSFKTAPGDAGPRYYVMMAGVGDEVLIPDCVIRGRQ